jgi:hypothetical protein
MVSKDANILSGKFNIFEIVLNVSRRVFGTEQNKYIINWIPTTRNMCEYVQTPWENTRRLCEKNGI